MFERRKSYVVKGCRTYDTVSAVFTVDGQRYQLRSYATPESTKKKTRVSVVALDERPQRVLPISYERPGNWSLSLSFELEPQTDEARLLAERLIAAGILHAPECVPETDSGRAGM